MSDRQKVSTLRQLLSEIQEANKAAWSAEGKVFIRNIAAADIDLVHSKRLMVGPPVAEDSDSVQDLQRRNVWGLYEMTDETARSIYEKTHTTATDETLMSAEDIARREESRRE